MNIFILLTYCIKRLCTHKYEQLVLYTSNFAELDCLLCTSTLLHQLYHCSMLLKCIDVI